MVLVVISIAAWLLTPILFSPFPRWSLIRQDLREFSSFIIGRAGTAEVELSEVVTRGAKGTARSLYELGLSKEISHWAEVPLSVIGVCLAAKLVLGAYLVLVLPASILDFLPVFVVALGCSWVVVLGYFVAGLNNSFLVVSCLIWPAVLPLAHCIIGSRFQSPSVLSRVPEYMISTVAFFYVLGVAKDSLLLLFRAALCLCVKPQRVAIYMRESVRVCFVYFCVHQVEFVEAYFMLGVNLLASAVIAVIDWVFCSCHTWFLFSTELARTGHGQKYMEKNTKFFELADSWSDFWAPDDEDIAGSPRSHRTAPGTGRRASA